MEKTIVILTTKGKKGNQETTEFIDHIIHVWECFDDEDEAFPSFFVIPYRNRKIRPQVCLAKYEIIKRNDHMLIV